MRNQTKVHFATVMGICVQENAELPDGGPTKVYKGRVVLRGDVAQDEHYDWVLFPGSLFTPGVARGSEGCGLSRCDS